jgi:hypothetical protein
MRPLKFLYKNWKGETREREVEPINVWYGKTEFHTEEQLFLKAKELEKNEERDFALLDIEKFL